MYTVRVLPRNTNSHANNYAKEKQLAIVHNSPAHFLLRLKGKPAVPEMKKSSGERREWRTNRDMIHCCFVPDNQSGRKVYYGTYVRCEGAKGSGVGAN